MYKKEEFLFCPCCGRKIIKTNPAIRSEVREEKETEKNWFPDYTQKCWKCGAQIGIKKVC